MNMKENPNTSFQKTMLSELRDIIIKMNDAGKYAANYENTGTKTSLYDLDRAMIVIEGEITKYRSSIREEKRAKKQ